MHTCAVNTKLYRQLPQNHYTLDYTNLGTTMNFQLVFAIMFNGCIGIMGEGSLLMMANGNIHN